MSTKRTRLERDFDPALVRQMKADAGHDLNVSGAPDGLRQPQELLDERRFGNGMVFLSYAAT